MSVNRIESDLETSRRRLANSVDELVYRAHPKNVAQRTAADARVKFAEATRTPEGGMRQEVIASVAAIGVLLIAMGILRRRNR
ncbi:DUF3618 domain-containing protein [Actinomycetota bacterium]|nr:DUF3618 domain-containing protein [Micrococcales bacterium]